MDILAIIVITLFLALVVNIALKKIHLPTIIGYIATGAIISYSLGLYGVNHSLMEIAEFGIVFLMFSIGLEFSIHKLKNHAFDVFVIGGMQILITGLISYFITAFVFRLDTQTAIVISLIIPLSSTAIVLKILNKNNDINKKYGQKSLYILLMQDLAVVPILLVIGLLANNDKTLSATMIDVVVGGIILVALLFVIAKYLIEPFINQVVKTASDELFIITILFLAIGSAYLAILFGFSASLGAFMAGMMIAETKYKHQVEADLVPFRDLLLGLFFITVGMQINFTAISQNFAMIFLVLTVILLVKFLVIFVLLRVQNGNRVAIKSAFALIQVGEFSLAALEIIRTNNLIAENHSQIILVVIILSMIITPILLKNIGKIADIFTPPIAEPDICTSVKYNNHIVLVGFGTLGKSIAKLLKTNNIEYVAIENNIDTFYKSSGENIIFGNASNAEIIKQANLKSAKFVIVAINNPDKLHTTCYNLQKFIASDKIVVKLHSKSEKNRINELDLVNIIVENDLTSEKIYNLIK